MKPQQTRQLPWVIRVAASAALGLTLLGLIVLYLAAGSVLSGMLAGLVGGEPAGLFRHPLLGTLAALLCVNIAIATLTRVRLSPANLGVWACHAGVIVLLAGSAWHGLAGVRGEAVSLYTGEGFSDVRQFQVALGEQSLPLGATMKIEAIEFQTYPASLVPKDFRCDVRITEDGRDRRETLSLNHPVRVGRYQISQGAWLPEPYEPRQLVFNVSSRRGLTAIWIGCVLIVAGMLYAFCVKPLLRPKGAGR